LDTFEPSLDIIRNLVKLISVKQATQKRFRLLTLACVLLITGCIFWQAYLDATDPHINGKRVSSWLAELDGKEFSDASVAIFVMGDLAIPQISQHLKARDGAFAPKPGSKWEKFAEKWGYLSAVKKQHAALKAIQILKQKAGPVAGDVVELLENKEFNASVRVFVPRSMGPGFWANDQNWSYLLIHFEWLGIPGEQALIQGLEHPSFEVRHQCIYLLSSLKVTRATEVLSDLLDSEEVEIRIAAADAIAEISADAKTAALRISALLADKNEKCREHAVEVLGRLALQDTSLLVFLTQAVNDPSVRVREVVHRHLSAIRVIDTKG
jgi:hypothetical protein